MADTLELLSKTAVTRRPGWSKTLVERLLCDPDETATHSTYKTQIGLYPQERILEAKKSPGYLNYQEKLAKRKKASIKAVKTKTDRLIDEIEAMKIKVVDPFGGMNKTGLAAERKGGRWMSCEIMLQYIRTQAELFTSMPGFWMNPSMDI